MEKTRNRLAESQPAKQGVARDLDRLRTDGNSSIEELSEFMGRMRGKSPQEMLGVVAQSRLAMSIVWSTVGCVALLAVLTVGPYLYNSAFAEEKPVAAKKSGPSNTSDTAANTTPPAGKTGANPATKKPDIAKKLGHTDVKTGTPGNIEKLLDGDK